MICKDKFQLLISHEIFIIDIAILSNQLILLKTVNIEWREGAPDC